MEPESIDLKKYFYVLMRRRYLFALVSAFVMATVCVGSFFVPKRYEASSTVFIEKNMIDSLMRNITITPSMSDRIRVLRYYMLSRDLISKTLKEHDVDVKVGDESLFEEMIQNYQNKVSVKIKGDDLFIISVRDKDPAFARDFINTLVGKYVEENISAKRQEAYGANRFLSEQVEYFKEKLNQMQDEIIGFRNERGLYSTVNEQTLLAEIKQHREEVMSLRLKVKELLATEKAIESQLAGEYPLLGQAFDGTSGNIAALQSQIEQLLVTYTENYPTVVKLRAEIEALESRSKQESKESVASAKAEIPKEEMAQDPVYADLKMNMFAVQSEIQALRTRESHLQGQIATKESELRSLPEEKKILAELEREKSTYEGLYNQLLSQVSRTEVSKQMEIADKTTTFRIVDPAILPTRPANVDRVYLMLLGIAVGFVSGVGAVMLRERLDGNFQDPDCLREIGIPVLAEIPTIFNEAEMQKRRKRGVLVYGVALSQLALVAALFLHDLMGWNYVDRMVQTSPLGRLVAKAITLIS